MFGRELQRKGLVGRDGCGTPVADFETESFGQTRPRADISWRAEVSMGIKLGKAEESNLHDRPR